MFIRNRLGMLESVETMVAHERRMEQISNNLANVDTTGFKKENTTFWEMLYRTNENRNRVGKAPKVITDFAAGPAKVTGNQLDFAIEGDGFFKVQTPDGIRYTRAGNFHLDNEGQLITSDGFPVLGEGGPVVVQGKDVSVAQDGTINVDNQPVNQLSVVSFADLASLQKEGRSLFRLKDGAAGEAAPQYFRVQQGYLEEANVNLTVELTEMIDLQRAYQAEQKLIQTIDEIDGMAVGRVGKLTE